MHMTMLRPETPFLVHNITFPVAGNRTQPIHNNMQYKAIFQCNKLIHIQQDG